MGRRTLIALFFAAACSGADNPTVVRPDGGEFCTAGSHTCPGGTRCVNSYCTPTCTGGAPCPAGTFCAGTTFPDDVCAPLLPAACASTNDCPLAQTCLWGRCVSQETVADGGVEACLAGAAQDKCAPDALCYIVNAAPLCVGLPSCGQDGGCPSGAPSQLCNLLPDGGRVVAGKGPVCVVYECAQTADCNSGQLCFHGAQLSWGTCQPGKNNDPCFSNADCVSAAQCDNPGPDGGSGDGGVPGKCRCVITTPDAGVCAL